MALNTSDTQSESTNPNESAYHVQVYGEVTGVGFRFSAIREARRYDGLRGFIRNKDHSTVECLVQGPEPGVSRFVEWIKTGPRSARVRDFDVETVSPCAELPPFQVKH